MKFNSVIGAIGSIASISAVIWFVFTYINDFDSRLQTLESKTNALLGQQAANATASRPSTNNEEKSDPTTIVPSPSISAIDELCLDAGKKLAIALNTFTESESVKRDLRAYFESLGCVKK